MCQAFQNMSHRNRKITAGQIPHRLICFQQMIHLPV
ncbi:hypothetical protein ABAC460_10735 [Asticcacaulis sp. AC460]|nr:hypothetical protein ABAC460_10735 [Asticcacaulis sp. AC460]